MDFYTVKVCNGNIGIEQISDTTIKARIASKHKKGGQSSQRFQRHAELQQKSYMSNLASGVEDVFYDFDTNRPRVKGVLVTSSSNMERRTREQFTQKAVQQITIFTTCVDSTSNESAISSNLSLLEELLFKEERQSLRQLEEMTTRTDPDRLVIGIEEIRRYLTYDPGCLESLYFDTTLLDQIEELPLYSCQNYSITQSSSNAYLRTFKVIGKLRYPVTIYEE